MPPPENNGAAGQEAFILHTNRHKKVRYIKYRAFWRSILFQFTDLVISAVRKRF